MKRPLLFFVAILLSWSTGFGQVYLDEFDNDDPAFTGGSGSYMSSEVNSEWTINADNTGPWDVFTYQPHDRETGEVVLVDMTENNKIFVRVKASNVGTQLRMDVQDEAGNITSLAGLTKTLTTEFRVLEFDFSGTYQDGGFGGTPCTSDTAPCAVDGTKISQLVFYTDPGAGGFNGSVVMDYIAFGAEVASEAMSEVYQDHFDKADSTITSFGFVGPGYSLSIDGSEITIEGDGSTGMWDPLSLNIRNQNTFEPIDIDISGNNKLFVKVKSTVPGTALRIDMQDIDGFITTQGSVTKIVDTEWTVLEYDYSGTYADLGFGGTPCTPETAPCPVDPTRISNMVMFIEPGVGGYVGQLTFDYFSFGTSLEPPGDAPLFLYGDHFSNETIEFTTGVAGLDATESGSNLVITGDGSAAPFGTVSYLLHDKETGEQVTVDMGPASNKVFISARTDGAMVPLRIDVIDTTGLTSSLTSLTKIIGPNVTIYEYDFDASSDGGYGGTPCETGPCPVNLSAIQQLLLYPNPIEGGFQGEMHIDFISIGQPLGEEEVDLSPAGIATYSDQFSENTLVFLSEAGGLTSSFNEDAITISGDGTSGPWTPIVYGMHQSTGEMVMVNAVANNNKLFIRAKSSVEGMTLRVDLQDNLGFVTNLNAVSTTLSDEYMVYELDYTDAYNDGGFGGSDCTQDTAPCPVDGVRIVNLQFFLEPGIGMFNGTVDIDWISFGTSLEAVAQPDAGVVNYTDQLPETAATQITDVDGLTTSIVGDTWTITGNGTGGMWTPLVYKIHNESGEGILANVVGSGDKIYVRAKASVDGTELRMDLQDYLGFVTNNNARSNTLSSEYAIYEYNYANAYADGGFGGSDCTSATAPCPVDGERISQLQFFVLPGVGGFNGTIDIDWISFGEPLSTSILEPSNLATFLAYPNPTREQLTLVYNLQNSQSIQVAIYDIFGKQISHRHLGLQSTGEQMEAIEVGTLTKGMYLIQLESNGITLGALRILKQ